MSFANLTPADRMKASGLVGVIVVIVFFVVHTLLGAVSPKTPSAGGATGPGGQIASPTVPPPSAVVVQTPGNSNADPWGAPSSPKGGAKVTDALQPVPDPFIPIRPLPGSVKPPEPAKPAVGLVKPGIGVERVNPGGSGSSLPGLPGMGSNPLPGPVQPAAVSVPAKPEPEIKVVGVVEGDDSLATLTVGGQTQLYRPGEVVVEGYRLMAVDGDSVKIRAHGTVKSYRPGDVLNDASSAKKQ